MTQLMLRYVLLQSVVQFAQDPFLFNRPVLVEMVALLPLYLALLPSQDIKLFACDVSYCFPSMTLFNHA